MFLQSSTDEPPPQLPKLCATRQWVLCISHSKGDRAEELVQYLAALNRDRGQDSVIFAAGGGGADEHAGLLKVRERPLKNFSVLPTAK